MGRGTREEGGGRREEGESRERLCQLKMSITARGASAGTVAAPACARTAASEHQGEVHRVQGAPLCRKHVDVSGAGIRW